MVPTRRIVFRCENGCLRPYSSTAGAVAFSAVLFLCVTARATTNTQPIQLQTLTNSCGANQVQNFFSITNNGTTSVKLSDLSVKFWAYDTTAAQNIAANVSAGGCLTGINGNPSCTHQVSGVTVAAVKFSPACGPTTAVQANWEVSISTTDTTLLPPGATWTGIQVSSHLANFANFTPGTSHWYSPCLAGFSYASDPRFGLYVAGQANTYNGVAAPICRAPHGQQQLSGNQTSASVMGTLIGPLSPSTTVNLAIGLPVQNTAALTAQMQAVTDPTSATYRQYLTPSQFAAQYGVSSATYQSLMAFAQAHGLTVTKTYGSNLLLDVTGTAQSVEQTFYVNLFSYQRADGTRFYAPDRQPSVDTSVPLLYIGNLDTSFVMKPSAGSGSNGTFQGTDFRNVYVQCSTMDGTGQSIGLLTGGGFSLGDVQSYIATTGVPRLPPITTVFATPSDMNYQTCHPAPGGVDTCVANSGCQTTGSACPNEADGALETTLDIEMAASMAPGAAEIVVFEGSFGDDLLHSMATRTPLILNLSSSFGFNRDASALQAIEEFVVQGQSFVTASGDSGGHTTDIADKGDLSYMTWVGGTELTTTGSPPTTPPRYASETGWSSSSGWVASGNTTLDPVQPPTPIPFYQTGIDMSQNGGSTQFRNIPDVAFPADLVNFVFKGQLQGVAGTSIASPLFAGYLALINQYSTQQNLEPVGFINPAIYTIAKSPPLYARYFHDIISGSSGPFNATKGYDLVTGLGSPRCGMIAGLSSRMPATTQPISASASSACAVRPGGTLWCWGNNVKGGLGNGSKIDSLTPVQTLVSGPVVGVSSRWLHACAILATGAASCWGSNDVGELGNGSHGNGTDNPFPGSGPSPVGSIAAGLVHTCVAMLDGSVKCWGQALGNGQPMEADLPVTVAGILNAAQVSAGEDDTCALLFDQTVLCWGYNGVGQLGNGSTTDTTSPVMVQGINSAIMIASGMTHVCALLSNGTVSCWGDNGVGELGNGTLVNSSVPVQVSNLTDAIAIGAGSGATCAVRASGAVVCWGGLPNSSGGLSTTPTPSPVPVSGISTARQVAVGDDNNFCAQLANGDVVCWGANFHGALGNGTTTDSLSPVAVQF
ncbi:MAG TPA: protease pro-enzyme activation domain-containing protein [Acidobacteriaceae bacterium]|nr:protease pro-enzyme activation domain-containing protein [Acidobacteriaceae bacterium]